MFFSNSPFSISSVKWAAKQNQYEEQVTLINKNLMKSSVLTVENTEDKNALELYKAEEKWISSHEPNFVCIGLATLRALEYGRMSVAIEHCSCMSPTITAKGASALGMFWLAEGVVHVLQGLIDSNNILVKATYLLGNGADLIINAATIFLDLKNQGSCILITPVTLFIFDCISLSNDLVRLPIFICQVTDAKRGQKARNYLSDKVLSTIRISSLIVASAVSITSAIATSQTDKCDGYNFTEKITAAFFNLLMASLCMRCFRKRTQES